MGVWREMWREMWREFLLLTDLFVVTLVRFRAGYGFFIFVWREKKPSRHHMREFCGVQFSRHYDLFSQSQNTQNPYRDQRKALTIGLTKKVI